MNRATFFEVYPKRALVEPIDGLPLMDRNDTLHPAKISARAWGGVVVRVEADVVSRWPLVRRILTAEVIWVHKPAPRKRPIIKHRTLMGKLRANDRSLYKKSNR
jgi:hypothetical protein